MGYGHMPYTSGSQCVGIGRTYCGGLKVLVQTFLIIFIEDLYQRFQECWNRYCLCQRFQKCWYSLYSYFCKYPIRAVIKPLVQIDLFRHFFNNKKSAGIGPEICWYMSLKLLVKAIPTQVKTSEQGLKSVGTYPGAFEMCQYRSRDLLLTVIARQFEVLGKKCRDRHFDHILALSRAIPAVLQTLGQLNFFVVTIQLSTFLTRFF